MNALTLMSTTPTMTSVDLLDFVNEARSEFSEAPVRHNDFLSRCKSELEGEPYETFVEPPRKTATGQIPAFEVIRMTADQCRLVAMRESKGVRRRVLARLKELEAQVAKPQQAALPQDYLEALEHLVVSEKAKQVAIAQRDHAIRTKAQIGSKREATAMATASAAKREVGKLRDQLGFSARHATILQVEDATGGDFDFVPLRRWCKANEVIPESVPDKRYPKGVKAWPAAAWMDAFGIDLVELFGGVEE